MSKTIVTKNVYPHLGIIDEAEEIVEDDDSTELEEENNTQEQSTNK